MDRILQELRRSGASASLRGSGAGEFVFAERSGKAAEVSSLGDGQWWVEFWEATADEDAPPVSEQTYGSADEAVRAVATWLATGES